jgi:prophage regulatory protein
MVAKILRVPDVLAARGKSRSGHYADISAGLFTKPVKVGVRAAGWPDTEVEALQAATIAGMPPEQVRQLVQRLTAERTAGVR